MKTGVDMCSDWLVWLWATQQMVSTGLRWYHCTVIASPYKTIKAESSSINWTRRSCCLGSQGEQFWVGARGEQYAEWDGGEKQCQTGSTQILIWVIICANFLFHVLATPAAWVLDRKVEMLHTCTYLPGPSFHFPHFSIPNPQANPL